MKKNPKVTIAIPTLNRSKYLTEAINSCLLQTYKNYEIVISDNKSDDDTEKIVFRLFNDYRIKYFRQPERVSAVCNWNQCVKLASGEFITFLCDDDLLKKGYIEELVKLLCLYPASQLAQSAYQFVDVKGKVIKKSMDIPQIRTSTDILLGMIDMKVTLPLDGLMCRAKVLKKLGGIIDVGFPGGFYSDNYTWAKVALEGKIVVGIKQPLWHYRVHKENADKGIDLEAFLSNIPNYTLLLKDLLLKHQCHIKKSQLDEFEKKIAVNWFLRDIENYRKSNSIWNFIIKIPYYHRIAYKYKIPLRYGKMIIKISRTLVNKYILRWL